MKGIDNQVSSSDNTNSAPSSDQRVDVPLGLGLGGLQPRVSKLISSHFFFFLLLCFLNMR